MARALVREATPEDAPEVVRLIHALAAADGEETPLDQDYAESYLSQPDSHVLVAEAGGQILGLLSFSIRPNLYHAGPVCLIEELVVDAPVRGRGIGSALLEEVMHRAAEQGCAEISVTTLPGNQPAIAFYRRHGLVDEAVYLEKHF